jgi:ketosteroid isomerase-like protein
LIDAGDDRVVGSFRQFGIGKESGAAVEQEYFIVYDVADRQLVRMRAFLDRGQALEAAGLRE